ncbi:MAG: DUF5808 domain-containing protein [Planctomycetota bacterium]|jgi:hypothetical protein
MAHPLDEQYWSKPENWRWWGYVCPDDPRIIVAKRPRWTGYTLNFAHKRAIPIMLAFLCFAWLPILWCISLAPDDPVIVWGGIPVAIVFTVCFCQKMASPTRAAEKEAMEVGAAMKIEADEAGPYETILVDAGGSHEESAPAISGIGVSLARAVVGENRLALLCLGSPEWSEHFVSLAKDRGLDTRDVCSQAVSRSLRLTWIPFFAADDHLVRSLIEPEIGSWRVTQWGLMDADRTAGLPAVWAMMTGLGERRLDEFLVREVDFAMFSYEPQMWMACWRAPRPRTVEVVRDVARAWPSGFDLDVL